MTPDRYAQSIYSADAKQWKLRNTPDNHDGRRPYWSVVDEKGEVWLLLKSEYRLCGQDGDGH